MHLKFDWLIVLENLRRGIMVTDTTLDGPKSPRIIYVNAVWLKMTGYCRDEIANPTPRMSTMVNPKATTATNARMSSQPPPVRSH